MLVNGRTSAVDKGLVLFSFHYFHFLNGVSRRLVSSLPLQPCACSGVNPERMTRLVTYADDVNGDVKIAAARKQLTLSCLIEFPK